MVAYMKRYDAGNELVKELLTEFRATGELGDITYVRNHGFCGDWIAGIDTPMERSDEPSPKPAAFAGAPGWLPERFYSRYVAYLQQYTHNLNLLRWFLDADGRVEVKGVHLDEDGMNGIVVLQISGIRVIIESGSLANHGWDEHTQIYFKRGWIKTSAPPLLLKNLPATVEVYRAVPSHQTEQRIPDAGWSWSYRREAEHFVECVAKGLPFRSSAEDTLHDVSIIEDIFRLYVHQQEC